MLFSLIKGKVSIPCYLTQPDPKFALPFKVIYGLQSFEKGFLGNFFRQGLISGQ